MRLKMVLKNVFGNTFNHVVCWAYAKRKIESLLSEVNDKDKVKEILQDIEFLQLSNSPSLFELGNKSIIY